MKFEKATYSRKALNEGLKRLNGIGITANRKNAHYPIYYQLKEVNEWLQDNAGNTTYFYKLYQLEIYREAVTVLYQSTTKASLDKMARLAKKEMQGMIHSIFQDAECGNLNIE